MSGFDELDVPPALDSANNEKHTDRPNTFPALKLFAVRYDSVLRKVLSIVSPDNGGPDAEDGPLVKVVPCATDPRTEVPLWTCTGPDKRVIKFGAWHHAKKKGMDEGFFVAYAPGQEFTVAPGSLFYASTGYGKAIDIPTWLVPVLEHDIDPNFSFTYKPKDGKLFNIGHYYNATSLRRGICTYAQRPASQRIRFGMPYALMLPPPLPETPAERTAWTIATSHTPAAAKVAATRKDGKPIEGLTAAKVPDLPPQNVEVVLRVSVNRGPRPAGSTNIFKDEEFMVDDEWHIAMETKAPAGCLTAVSKREEDHLVTHQFEKEGPFYYRIKEHITLDVIVCRSNMADFYTKLKAKQLDRMSIMNLEPFPERFLTLGCPFAPLAAALLHNAYGYLPYDAVVRLDPLASAVHDTNLGGEQRSRAFPAGAFVGGYMEAIVPRVEEFCLARAVEVSADLLKHRYAGYDWTNMESGGIFTGDPSVMVKTGFGRLPTTKQPEPPLPVFNANEFTASNHPGFVLLDCLAKPWNWKTYGATDFRYFAVALYDKTAALKHLEDPATGFGPLQPLYALEFGVPPKKIRAHKPAEGDAFVRRVVGELAKRGATFVNGDVDALQDLGAWLQPPMTRGKTVPDRYALPWFVFIAIPVKYAPLRYPDDLSMTDYLPTKKRKADAPADAGADLPPDPPAPTAAAAAPLPVPGPASVDHMDVDG